MKKIFLLSFLVSYHFMVLNSQVNSTTSLTEAKKQVVQVEKEPKKQNIKKKSDVQTEQVEEAILENKEEIRVLESKKVLEQKKITAQEAHIASTKAKIELLEATIKEQGNKKIVSAYNPYGQKVNRTVSMEEQAIKDVNDQKMSILDAEITSCEKKILEYKKNMDLFDVKITQSNERLKRTIELINKRNNPPKKGNNN
jgi:hypothetical protein